MLRLDMTESWCDVVLALVTVVLHLRRISVWLASLRFYVVFSCDSAIESYSSWTNLSSMRSEQVLRWWVLVGIDNCAGVVIIVALSLTSDDATRSSCEVWLVEWASHCARWAVWMGLEVGDTLID